MAYGDKRNRSQTQATTNSNTNSFRQVTNNQDFTSGGINWESGKDIPKYWSSVNTGSDTNIDKGVGYSIDSGYCEWSPGNRIYVGDTGSQGTQPAGLNDGASSRYCYQWSRVGAVVTGSGRVQLGVNGGADGTSATWLQYAKDNNSQALYTSYDLIDQDRLSGNFVVASIPLPVYYQTNINVSTGASISPPVESRADLVNSPINSTNATGLRGSKKKALTPADSGSVDRWIGGAGTLVGSYWNAIGDDGYSMKLYYPNGQLANFSQQPPILNCSGVVHFDKDAGFDESMNTGQVVRYMNLIVKAPMTPGKGASAGNMSAYPATNLMNFGGSTTYGTTSKNRFILPPMFHFTFSYTLGGYPTLSNVPIS